MPGFLSGGLIILISGEASMLSTSIMKMFKPVNVCQCDLEEWHRNCINSLL